MAAREDNTKREVVDKAILLFDAGEKQEAIRILEEAKVSDATIDRVLFHPDLRRRYINRLMAEQRITYVTNITELL